MLEILKDSPVIAAVKDETAFTEALAAPPRLLFLLAGDIASVERQVERAHAAGKKLLVHMDLIDGFGKDESALRFLAARFHPDGIITTKSHLALAAKKIGLFTAYRAFIVDAQSRSTALGNLAKLKPDLVEIMPGIMPTVIRYFAETCATPLIAGGLIKEAHEVRECLKAGASGVSTSCRALWNTRV